MKELIRRLVFFSDFPATADLPANDIFLHVDRLSFDRTAVLHSHTMVGLE